jgi:SAM-dependent methyltransferase
VTGIPPRGTAAEFGEEWSRYPEILPEHRAQFQAWIQPIEVAEFAGKRFLDAGCGTGRNSVWPLEAGAAEAVAFDADPRTVAVARKNLQRFPHCRVEQCSIYDLPHNNEFDIVFCLGVVHHLAEPRRALEKLVKTLKPGGRLIVWVYGREGNGLYLTLVEPFRRLTSRLPARVTLMVSKLLTVILRASLVLPWKDPYMRFLRGLGFRHTEAIVFDQLLPSIAHYWRRGEVLSLVSGLPLRVDHLTHVRGMSWTLVGTKE